MVSGMLTLVGSKQLMRCMVDGTLDFLTFELKFASYNTFSITITARRVQLTSLKEAASNKVASKLCWEAANLVASAITLEETLTSLEDWESAMLTWQPALTRLTFSDLFVNTFDSTVMLCLCPCFSSFAMLWKLTITYLPFEQQARSLSSKVQEKSSPK